MVRNGQDLRQAKTLRDQIGSEAYKAEPFETEATEADEGADQSEGVCRTPGPTNPKTAPKLNLMDAKSLPSKPSKRIGKIG